MSSTIIPMRDIRSSVESWDQLAHWLRARETFTTRFSSTPDRPMLTDSIESGVRFATGLAIDIDNPMLTMDFSAEQADFLHARTLEGIQFMTRKDVAITQEGAAEIVARLAEVAAALSA